MGTQASKVTQAFPPAQPCRAQDVHCEVAITKPKPSLPTEVVKLFHEIPSFVGASPAAVWIGESTERVKNRIEIGRDVQPKVLEIVARIHDHRESPGLKDTV